MSFAIWDHTYGILPRNTLCLNPSQTGQHLIFLPQRDGWLSDRLHTKIVYPPTDGHPSTSPLAHGWESNSQPDALTIALLSH